MRLGGGGGVDGTREKHVLEAGLHPDALHDVLRVAGVVAHLRRCIHGKKALARHQQRGRRGQRDQ